MSGTPDPKLVEPTPEPTLIEQPGSIPETVVPADESLTNQEQVEAEPESNPEQPPVEEKKEPAKKPWFQTRIDELTRARRDAERKAAEAEAKAQVLEASQAKPDQPITSLNREQYQKDVAAEAQRQIQQQTYATRSRSWLDAGVKEYGMEDFNQRCDMVAAMGAADRPEFMQMILDPDLVPDGHKVVAQLAENPDEAQRILSLDSPVKMAAALTRFAMTAQPEKRQVSNAPKPISPIGGTAKASGAPSDNDPTPEWMAKRRAEVAARKKRA